MAVAANIRACPWGRRCGLQSYCFISMCLGSALCTPLGSNMTLVVSRRTNFVRYIRNEFNT